MAALPAAIVLCVIILYFVRTEAEPWILLLVTLVFAADIIVLIVFVGKSPDLVLSPRYFGFTRYFGVYRVRWDRVKQVETTLVSGVNKTTVSFLNDKGISESLTLRSRDFEIGDGIIGEIKRLRAGGY